MRILLLVYLMPLILFAQSYFEASGQTVVFTLSAGTKASWNQGAAIEKAVTNASFNGFRIRAAGNGLFINNAGKSLLKLYDVRGRIVVSLAVEHDGFIPLSHKLSNGVYVARVEAPGIMRVATLAVVR